MTIEKSKPWGKPGVIPDDVVFAVNDSQVAAFPELRVQPIGGNLWRSLGSPQRRDAGDACTELPIDVLRCTVAHHGEPSIVIAVSEVCVGSWFARDGMTVITNVGTFGDMNLAPRAHPNDGEFDSFVLDGSTSWRQRVLARRRSVTGTHVPHPTISVTRGRHFEITRHGRAELLIDGQPHGPWTSLSVDIVPDFMTVLV